MTDAFNELIQGAAEVELDDKARTIEETLLVGLFTTPEAAARITGETKPTDFFFDLHRRFAGLAYGILREGGHVDRVTLTAAVERGFNFDEGKREEIAGQLDKILPLADQVFEKAKSDPPPLGKVESYLSIFTEAARRRWAGQLVAKAGEELRKGEKSPTGAAGDVFRAIAELEASQRLAGATKSEGDDLEAYFAALEARQSPDNDFQGLDTGFTHLNRVINGLTDGSLFVLGAAPSTGKTTLAKQLFDQVAELNEDVACLFISLEQSKEELRVKSLSRLSGVENRDIFRGRLDTSAQGWKRLVKAKEELAKFADKTFIVEGDRDTTPDRIRLLGLQVRQRTQAARLLIVVDYLQIVSTEKDFTDIRRQVDTVVSDLRRLARDIRASIVVVSSIGRASYKEGAGAMDSFKESGGIEYGADVGGVMVLDKGKTKGEENILGVTRQWKRVQLDIVKNRNGEKARIGLNFFPAISYFAEVSQESLPEGG